MSKAVLIMDMPERCDKCSLLLKVPQKNGLALCLARNDNGQLPYNPKNESSWRPDWCPLVELPDERESDPVMDHDIDFGFSEGWNACIDAIVRCSRN